MYNIHQPLKEYFGYDQFRPLQEEIIHAVLDGKNILALLPTGGGKSLCYQIPALVQPGICLVITPLIALMKDQVIQLRKKNISALSIHSGMAFYEVKKALQNATSGEFKFLFVSPERLQTNLFKEYLPGMPLNLIAVDEAHCISQWGYDFRPPYLQIASVREEWPDIPILALTATATQEVQTDICDKLGFKERNILRQSFEKPNLSFSVFHTPHKINKLYEILHNVPGSALVYVRNRRRTKEIARLLEMQGIKADYYHAGLSNDERNRRQEEWLKNTTPVMVCTNAFGMGIDKPDVRTVVHMDIPDCIESYSQEAGRAGRDRKKAYAVLLYNDKDMDELEQLPAKKFPSIKQLRQTYEAICHYLQLPVGTGEGQYFDFNLTECCERFKIDANLMVNALHTLEQAGYISFSESVFIPSKAGFAVSKENLYAFEKDKPELEPILTTLLRNYEGIFDNLVNIHERTIAKLLKAEDAIIQTQLQQLHDLDIIHYHPKKDSPQLFFIYNRVSTNELTIDEKAYEKRRKKYQRMVDEMGRYTREAITCRSEIIRAYFGDTDIKPCGICDNCLRKKNNHFSSATIQQTAHKVLDQLRTAASFQQIQQSLKISTSLAEASIQYLIREEKIEWKESGLFYLK